MVLDKVKEIVANQMRIAVDDVHDTTSFRDLESDSLDVVEVIMAVESEFNIILPDEVVETFKNVSDLAKYIEEQLR